MFCIPAIRSALSIGNRWADQSIAVGCRDALQLGQTHYQQYEEITALKHSQYRVYRSLSQPDQFLVVPLQYCISRQSAIDAEAYRPLIVLYASIDPNNVLNNWVTLRCDASA